jgi:hypothetical protein
MATKIRSDAPAWLSPTSRGWAYLPIDLAYSRSKALQGANEVITAARTIGLSPRIDVTEFEINELGRRQQLMINTTESIHYEVDELIDNPFVRRISTLMENVYALKPRDLTVQDTDPSGASVSYRLDMLLPEIVVFVDIELFRDFMEKSAALNTDSVPADFNIIMGVALYWQREYKKAHIINQIIKEMFTDEVRTDWKKMNSEERLAILEQYARRIGRVMGDGVEIVSSVNYDPETTGGNVTTWYDRDTGTLVDREGKVNIATYYGKNIYGYSLDAALEAVTHEVRHEYQAAVKLDSQSIISTNDGVNAITPVIPVPKSLIKDWNDRSIEYFERPIEIDARAFAGLGMA